MVGGRFLATLREKNPGAFVCWVCRWVSCMDACNELIYICAFSAREHTRMCRDENENVPLPPK